MKTVPLFVIDESWVKANMNPVEFLINTMKPGVQPFLILDGGHIDKAVIKMPL